MDLGYGGDGPCGACKFLRRKCVKGCCIFAPYFESSGQGSAHFAAVHKVFGASNAAKLLMRIPVHKRLDAVVTLCYEALARATDPVYGCVAHIFALQQQVYIFALDIIYIYIYILCYNFSFTSSHTLDHIRFISIKPDTLIMEMYGIPTLHRFLS
jgi:hypothetical protein